MATILIRTIVLSFSRIANQAIVLLSPILLVRILSVEEYGRYQEFLVYAALISPFVTFSAGNSLAYLVPRYPKREQVWITQCIVFVLAFSAIALVAIHFLGDTIQAGTSYDFVAVLQLYILFSCNLDFLELYWLGKKRTDYVLYYSAARLLVRLAVVVTTAAVTRDAKSIVVSLVVMEAIRCLLVLWYAVAKRWLGPGSTRQTIKEQVTYFMPLGVGAVVEGLNRRAGMLFISTQLGAEALAFYVTGAFAMKVVNVLRGAIADVIFPEIVELRHANKRDSLPLWQRATVWYCILLFPTAVLLAYYADAFVTVLFTTEYADAVPVFAAFAFVLFVHSFDFHLPLRVQNQNRWFVRASILALVINLVLLIPLNQTFGLVGPAIAFVISRACFGLYLARKSSKVYEVSVVELVRWVDVGKVLIAAVICIPILFLGTVVTENLPLRGAVFGAAYGLAYLLALRIMRVWDPLATVRSLFLSLRRRWKRGGVVVSDLLIFRNEAGCDASICADLMCGGRVPDHRKIEYVNAASWSLVSVSNKSAPLAGSRIHSDGRWTLAFAGDLIEAQTPPFEQVCMALETKDFAPLRELEGIFAFVAFDAETNRVFAVSDRRGQKPLFYSRTPIGLQASSSPAVLTRLMDSPEFDERWLWENLFFNFPVDSTSFLKGVKRIPSASVLSSSSAEEDVSIVSYAAAFSRGSTLKEGREALEYALTVFSERVPRYFAEQSEIACALTAGWDARTVIALAPDPKTIRGLHLWGAGL